MASSISATGFKGGFGMSSFMVGEEYGMLAKTMRNHVRVAKPVRMAPMMKNVNEGKGLFAPIVVVTRNIIGKKRFNQLRGKAIALHSQVAHSFCNYCLFRFAILLIQKRNFIYFSFSRFIF